MSAQDPEVAIEQAGQPPRVVARFAGISMAAAGASVVAAALIYLAFEFPAQRDAVGASLRSLATVLAANSAGAIERESRSDGTQVLATLRDNPAVEQSLLFGHDGRLIASFSAAGHIEGDGVLGERNGWLAAALSQPVPSVRYLGLTRAEVLSPVLQDGELLGHVYLSGSLEPLRAQLLRYLFIALLAGVFAVAAAGLLARRLSMHVASTMANMWSAMLRVMRGHAYDQCAARAQSGAMDELVECFNKMLVHIDARERELQKHRESLETLVGERSRAHDKLALQLREANTHLEDAQRALEARRNAAADFLARLGADLRQSLATAMGASDVVMQRPLDANLRRIADLQLGVLDSTLSLCNVVTNFAASDDQGTPLDIGEFDFGRLCQECVGAFARRAHDKKIELVAEVDPGLGNLVQGDAGAMRQVCLNLISNAVKYTTRGSVTVRLKFLGEKLGVLGLRLEVIDTGIGVRPEVRKTLLDMTASDGTRRRGMGGGAGLSACRQVIEAMGGRIGIDSELGRGSTFTVDVTLAAGSVLEGSKSATTASPQCRLLLLDSDAARSGLLLAQLADAGYLVRAVADAEAAVAELTAAADRHEPFDLIVVSDAQVDEPGQGLVQRLRAAARSEAVPVLLLTSNVADDRTGAFRRLTPIQCLSQPVDSAMLQQAARQLLGLAVPKNPEIAQRRVAAEELTAASVNNLLSDPECGAAIATTPDLDATMLASLGELDPGGERGLIARLVRVFVDDSLRLIGELDTALANEDAPTVTRLVHSLKSSAANLGLKRLAALCAAAEANARQGNLFAVRRVRPQISQLRDVALEALRPHGVGCVA